MSRLDQTKREAARLFKLAKHNPNNLLPINNLSHAKEYVAQMKGYSDWHAYEASVKKKDFVNNIESDVISAKKIEEALQQKSYFLEELEYVTHISTVTTNKPVVFIPRTHAPVWLGSKRNTYLNKPIQLSSYPVMVSGTTGAGKSEFLRTLFAQYVVNDEGCIYMDFRGDLILAARCYAHLAKKGKEHSLRILNFSSQLKHKSFDIIRTGPTSNTIDPINPLIGCPDAFVQLFDTEVGLLIHGLALIAKERNELIDLDNIASILKLPNLITWTRSNYWGTSGTQLISAYLEHIGLYDDADEATCEAALCTHALLASKAKLFVETMSEYRHVFSLNPDVNLFDVFKNRQYLFVSLPALEKVPVGLTILSVILTAQLVNAAIAVDSINTEMKTSGNHWQNVILDSFYTLPAEFTKIISKRLPASSNWVFGIMDFDANAASTSHLLPLCNTYVFMRHESKYFPDYLKLKILENIEALPPMFYKRVANHKEFNLNSFKCGEAVVFYQTNDLEYKLEPVSLNYVPEDHTPTFKINTFD